VIQQLSHGNAGLARIAERVSPGKEVECGVGKLHLLRKAPLLALLGGNRKHHSADRLGHAGHAAGIGFGAVAPFHFQHDVPVPNHHRRELAVVALQQPILQRVDACRVHPALAADCVGPGERAPAAL